ncbi:hypothetical protein BG005_009010 [Podila minutissima]|nr:hypothetical protein BG005_009010 [Podila minutissima]
MSPRPARAAAKGVSYKPKSGKKKSKRGAEGSDDSEVDMDDFQMSEPDDDDSDEYIAPADAGNPEDDDEDIGPIEEDEDDGEGEHLEDDEEPQAVKKKRSRRQEVQFAANPSELKRLLSENSNGQGSDTNQDNTGGILNSMVQKLEIVPSSLPVRMSNRTVNPDRKRSSSHPLTKRHVHKKGEMHKSNAIPLNWKLSHQGPTSFEVHHVSMTEEALRNTVYPHICSNIKDFKVVTDPSDLDEYFPVITTSTANIRDQELSMPIMTGEYVKTTEETAINDFYLINAGLSVWALDWCPLSSNDELSEKSIDYIAVGGFPDTAENCRRRDQTYPLGKQDSHPNVIQIWSVHCDTNEEGILQGDPEVYMSLCILHNYGAVLDMKWCPNGNLMDAGTEPGSLTRLGILAATFSDGTIRIFSIPEPKSLQEHLDIDASSKETIYIQFPEPYVTLRLGEVCFMSINWGTPQRLVAGCTNGTVAIWDTKSMLDQSSETLAEKDSEHLDPIHLPQLHDVSIRSVDFLRDQDPNVIPTAIISTSYDGRVRFTDTRDVFSPVEVRCLLGVPASTMGVPWGDGFVYVDADGAVKMEQMYVESAAFRVFAAQGYIWDLSYSDFQPYFACAVSDGKLHITNPAYSAKRGYGMIQNTVYQLKISEEVEAEETTQEAPVEDETASQTAMEGLSQTTAKTYHYLEGQDKDYLAKADGFLRFYHINVAIQKVQWSRCFHSAAWLASGSSGGLVRIDNTMLKTNEGGSSNKIHYEPDAYRARKLIAKGQDPNKVPVKLGRPRKEGVRRSAKTGKILHAKAGTKSKGPSKKTSGKAKMKEADDDGDEEGEHDGSADDEDFETRDMSDAEGSRSTPRVSTRPVRSARLTATKLAPIFAMSKSKASGNRDDENDDEPADLANEEEEDDEDEPLTKSKTRKPTGTITPASSEPPKRRGRPPKKRPVANELDKISSDTQSLLSMLKGGSASNEAVAPRETEDQDTRMEGPPETVSPGPSNEAPRRPAATSTPQPAKGRGRARQAPPTEARRTDGEDAIMAEPESNVTSSIRVVKEVTTESRSSPVPTNDGGSELVFRSLSPIPSAILQSQQHAPASPRKKRGSYNTKKKAGEMANQPRSVKDLWGTAAAKNVGASSSTLPGSTKSADK